MLGFCKYTLSMLAPSWILGRLWTLKCRDACCKCCIKMQGARFRSEGMYLQIPKKVKRIFISVCLYLYLSPFTRIFRCWLKILVLTPFTKVFITFTWKWECQESTAESPYNTHTRFKRFTNSSLFMKSKNNSRSDKLHHPTNFFEFNFYYKMGDFTSKSSRDHKTLHVNVELMYSICWSWG